MKITLKIYFLLFCVLAGAQSFAKLTDAQIKAIRERQPGLTSKSVQRRLMRVNEHLVQNNRKAAIEILEKMVKESKYRPFEMGKIWQSLAYAYAQTEQYPKARNAFKQVIKINALPYKPHMQSIFAISQLLVMAEKYNEAESYLNDYFALADKENPDAHMFSATISFHKGNKKKALTSILKALKISK